MKKLWSRFLLTLVRRYNQPIERLGSNYGGWSLCPDNLGTNSIIYSIGIGEDITFDLALIDKYGCHVYAFDPTPRSINWLKKQNLPKLFSYFEIGLANYNGEATFFPPENPEFVSHSLLYRSETQNKAIKVPVQTLSAIMKKLHHDRIDLLKIDIEGAEYDVIDNLLLAKLDIQQILVEFHHHFPNVSILCTIRSTISLLCSGYSLIAISPSGYEYSFMKNNR